MGLAQKVLLYTEEEYLALEREADERHEYIEGNIYAMAGESLSHGFITINLGSEFRAQLKGRERASLSPNMNVRSGPDPKFSRTTKGFFSYADLMVFCGKPLIHDEFRDVLLNPKVIMDSDLHGLSAGIANRTAHRTFPTRQKRLWGLGGTRHGFGRQRKNRFAWL